MSETLSILLVEDDEDDYLIASEFLEEIPGRRVDLRWVDCYDEGMKLVEAGGIDICLVDYRIGGRTGLEFLASAKANGLTVPMVLLTGVGQRDIDVAATEAGAADFLDKSELSSTILDRTIRYAIANAETLRALAEKTGFLETTLENTGAGIAAFDKVGTVTMSNNHFAEFMLRFGETNAAELTIEKVAEILGAEPSGQTEIVAPDGNVFELRNNPVPAGGCVLFVLDITEQKSLEQQMLRARNDAETTSRAKSAFLSNISHELRTPLHSIIGYSDLILSDSRALDPKDCAGQIHESGTHLLTLIESVLAYSKLESGGYSCKSDRIFELDGLMTSSIAQVAVGATRREITVDFEVDPTIESIYGDQMALRQILVNLITNAVEFSEDGDKVDVLLRARPDGSAELIVRDYGSGMEPEKVSRIFDPFVQLDDTLDRSHEGAGLGLPIVKSLVEHHDAEIEIETALGTGTSVIVVLGAERVRLREAQQLAVG